MRYRSKAFSTAPPAKARYLKNAPASVRNKVCLMLGSRDDESARRADNILRMGGQADSVSLTEHGGELYPVKEWRAQDIWSFLMACGSLARFPLPSFCRTTSASPRFTKTRPGNVSGRRRNPLSGLLPAALAMDARYAAPSALITRWKPLPALTLRSTATGWSQPPSAFS